VNSGARLVWLPSDALGILPLGLAQEPVMKRRFTDDYEISYAPSLKALTAIHDEIKQSKESKMIEAVARAGTP
jgi:CHAT domain